MSTQKQGSGDRAGEERDDLSEGAALSSDEARATDEERATTLDLPPEELSALARAFYELTLDYIGSPNALPGFPPTDAAPLAANFPRAPRRGPPRARSPLCSPPRSTRTSLPGAPPPPPQRSSARSSAGSPS